MTKIFEIEDDGKGIRLKSHFLRRLVQSYPKLSNQGTNRILKKLKLFLNEKKNDLWALKIPNSSFFNVILKISQFELNKYADHFSVSDIFYTS